MRSVYTASIVAACCLRVAPASAGCTSLPTCAPTPAGPSACKAREEAWRVFLADAKFVGLAVVDDAATVSPGFDGVLAASASPTWQPAFTWHGEPPSAPLLWASRGMESPPRAVVGQTWFVVLRGDKLRSSCHANRPIDDTFQQVDVPLLNAVFSTD